MKIIVTVVTYYLKEVSRKVKLEADYLVMNTALKLMI